MIELYYRKKCRVVAVLLRGLTVLALPGQAGEPVAESQSTAPAGENKISLPSLWDGKITFDVEERVRGEIRENNRDFDSSITDNTDDSWLLNRFRLGVGVKPVSWLKVYGQMQDSREAFSTRPNIPAVGGAEGDDEFDLRQAYVSFGDVKNFPNRPPFHGGL